MSAFYQRRLNKVNYVDRNMSDLSPSLAEQIEKLFCKRCQFRLIYREDLDNLFCIKCAWEPPKKKEKEEEEEEKVEKVDSDNKVYY